MQHANLDDNHIAKRDREWLSIGREHHHDHVGAREKLFEIADREELLLIVRVVPVSRHSTHLLWLSGMGKKRGERTT